MFRQVVQRLVPVGNVVSQQMQRNFGVSAVMAQQKASLDPIQQLFVDKIREYRTKSAGGKLVDATPQTESTLKDMMETLERAYGAKGVDMTQFPTLNFTEPDLVWPGLKEEEKVRLEEAAKAAEKEAEGEQAEEETIDPWEAIP